MNKQVDKGKLDMVTVVEGKWELSWALSYMDGTKAFEINKAYDINGHEVLVKSVELFPLSMTLDLGGGGLKQLADDAGVNELDVLLFPKLTLRNAAALVSVNGGPGSECCTGTSYTRIACFDKVLDVDQITASR